MNESSYLTVLKILVDEVILSKPSIERSDSLIIGSLTQLHSFLAYVKSRDYDADQFKNHEKEYLAKIIHWHLHFVEKSNAYMTVETKDCLQQLQKMFTLGRNDVLRYNAEISVEIEKLNKIRIKDDVSLLDLKERMERLLLKSMTLSVDSDTRLRFVAFVAEIGYKTDLDANRVVLPNQQSSRAKSYREDSSGNGHWNLISY
uniref:Uncharacterized protein n=1 Tax=Trichogramma kaykai TaxID=54128 RepID=A0ABD2X5P2_9HYME